MAVMSFVEGFSWELLKTKNLTACNFLVGQELYSS